MPIDKFPRKTSGQAARTGLGDLEYFSELRNAPSGDPWATLGTKVSGAGLAYGDPNTARFISSYPFNSQLPDMRAQVGGQPTFNTVYTGTDRNVPAVQNHEFRHAASEYIRDNFTKEDVIKRWGEEAGAVYNRITQASTNEASVEAFDRPRDQATGQTPAFGGETTGESIEMLNGPYGWTDPAITDSVRRLMGTMSSDIMADLGVPSRSKPQNHNPFSELLSQSERERNKPNQMLAIAPRN